MRMYAPLLPSGKLKAGPCTESAKLTFVWTGLMVDGNLMQPHAKRKRVLCEATPRKPFEHFCTIVFMQSPLCICSKHMGTFSFFLDLSVHVCLESFISGPGNWIWHASDSAGWVYTEPAPHLHGWSCDSRVWTSRGCDRSHKQTRGRRHDMLQLCIEHVAVAVVLDCCMRLWSDLRWLRGHGRQRGRQRKTTIFQHTSIYNCMQMQVLIHVLWVYFISIHVYILPL